MDNFYVLENFHRKFSILVALTTDVTTKLLVPCKVLQSSPLIDAWNCVHDQSINGDAILPQNATKLTTNYWI